MSLSSYIKTAVMHSNSYFLNSLTQCSFSHLVPNACIACVDGISQYMLQAPMLHSFAIPNAQYSMHYAYLTSTQSVLDRASINAVNSVYTFNPAFHMLVYKPVTKKVRTVVLLLEGLIGCSEYNDYHNCT
jgi:hypothetical protein